MLDGESPVEHAQIRCLSLRLNPGASGLFGITGSVVGFRYISSHSQAFLRHPYELHAGELAALAGVDHLRFALTQGILQGLNTALCLQALNLLGGWDNRQDITYLLLQSVTIAG